VPVPEGAKEGATAVALAEGTRAACVDSIRTVIEGAALAIKNAGPRTASGAAAGGASGEQSEVSESAAERSASVTAFLASHILELPSLAAIQQAAGKAHGCVDPAAVADAKKGLQVELGQSLQGELNAVYAAASERLASGGGGYDWDSQLDKACRAIRATALSLLAKGESAAPRVAEAGAGDSAADRALAL